jgi:hypothetical protein
MATHWKQELSRRSILKGIGVSVALPLLDAMFPRHVFADQAQAGIPRFVAINIPLGFYSPHFLPVESW